MKITVCVASLLLGGLGAFAQDPFEIQIYTADALAPGRFSVEQHLNYVGMGTKAFNGSMAPTNDQFHMTYEFTGGITPDISLGVMLLTAARPGGAGLQYAGWRILPHFYAPKSWHLPVELGVVAEFSFQRTLFEENSRRIEIRPIVEKTFGHVRLTANPGFERALHGPGVGESWRFAPAGRVAYQEYERFVPSVEYYSSLGPVRELLPASEQVHQLYAGGDLRLREGLIWNFGLGVGVTSAGDRLVIKSRLEYEFGRKE